MPQVQRKDIPRQLMAHLLLRLRERHIGNADLMDLTRWLDTKPEVPVEDWFKRFPTMIVCGHGQLIKTFLEPTQTAVGVEVQ